MCTIPGYILKLTCPDCGHPLSEINHTQPTRYEATSVAQCANCGHEWQITVCVVGLTNQKTAAASARRRNQRHRAAARQETKA